MSGVSPNKRPKLRAVLEGMGGFWIRLLRHFTNQIVLYPQKGTSDSSYTPQPASRSRFCSARYARLRKTSTSKAFHVAEKTVTAYHAFFAQGDIAPQPAIAGFGFFCSALLFT